MQLFSFLLQTKYKGKITFPWNTCRFHGNQRISEKLCFAAQIKHLPPIVIFIHDTNPDLIKMRTNPQNRRKLLDFGNFSFFVIETLKILLKYVKQRILNFWEAMFFCGALVSLFQYLWFIFFTLVQNSYVSKLEKLHSLRKITWQIIKRKRSKFY